MHACAGTMRAFIAVALTRYSKHFAHTRFHSGWS